MGYTFSGPVEPPKENAKSSSKEPKESGGDGGAA